MWRAVFALLLLSTACSGDNGPSRIEVEGTWRGTFTDKGDVGGIQMTLQEANGAVTGAGSLSITDALAVTVTGTYSPPHVSLTLSAPGVENVNLSGTVGETTLDGTLNGSGFFGSGLTMHRQ